MTSQLKINEMRAAQRERIRDAIMDGQSMAHICSVEGVDENTVKVERRKLKAAGHTVPNGTSPAVPFGLTEASRSLRTYLGNIVYGLIERRKALEPMEAATVLGIPQKLLKETWENSKWDWKLSEIERLARHQEVDFTQLMLAAMRPGVTASKEDIRKWNQFLSDATIGSSAAGSTSTRP